MFPIILNQFFINEILTVRISFSESPLTWDPTIGEGAGEMEFFIRYLIMSLLSNLQNKAKRYTMDDKDSKANSQMKAYLFILNNTFYLNEQLGENTSATAPILRNKIDDMDDIHYNIRQYSRQQNTHHKIHSAASHSSMSQSRSSSSAPQ